MASSLSAVIAAAGAGRRYGGLGQLQDKVGGKSVLSHSLDVFEADEDCSEIILVVSAEVRAWIAGDPLTFASGKLKLVDGGETRADSIAAGARAAQGELLALHDGNRPNISEALLARLKATVLPERGAVPGLMLTDGVAYLTAIGDPESGNGSQAPVDELFGGKKTDHRLGHLMEHVDPSALHLLQTPQLYYRESYLQALDNVGADLGGFADDSAIYLAGGYEVAVVPGPRGNIKVVTPADLRLLLKLMGGGTRKKKDKYGGLGW